MAYQPRAKPYSLAIRGVNDLDTALPILASDSDDMFDILFTDLAGIAGDVTTASSSASAAVASVVNDTNVTGVIAAGVLTLGWTGTLNVARGGLGQDASGVTNGMIPIGSTGALGFPGSFVLAKLTQGAGITITNGGGAITIASSASAGIFPATANLGDIFYASAANTISALAKDANATRYLSNQGASNIPSWSLVNLANGVTGTLAVGNGGTGIASYSAGDILYASAATTLVNLAKGTAVQLLHSGTTPTWSAVSLTADVTGNLPVTNLNSGTSATSSTYWRGDGIWAVVSATDMDTILGFTARWGTMTAHASNGTLFAANCSVNSPLGGSVANGTDATAAWLRYSTGGVANTNTGASAGSNTDGFACNNGPTTFYCKMRTGSSIASQKFWVGFLSNQTVATLNVAAPAATSIIAFRFIQGTDTSWIGVTSAAGTQSTTAAIGAAVAISTVYLLKMTCDGTTATFDVNGTSLTLATNLPSTTQQMIPMAMMIETGGAVRFFDMNRMYFRSV